MPEVLFKEFGLRVNEILNRPPNSLFPSIAFIDITYTLVASPPAFINGYQDIKISRATLAGYNDTGVSPINPISLSPKRK